MKPEPLTLEHLHALLPHLGARDRAEILRMYPDLEAWARSRIELGGAAWAGVIDGEVIVVGGVITNSAKEGVLWIAGRDGWARRHIRHALRVFDVIKGFGGYTALRCKCVADNLTARRFAERLGFDEIQNEGDLVHYRMAT